MDHNSLATQAKNKNIVDMALNFTAMGRVFRKGSFSLIKEKLNSSLQELDSIDSEQDYNNLHDNFCDWFVKNIKVAKGGEAASYGHAAKVLDIVLKVYVYYCNLPTPEKAEILIPMLNGAIDGPILKHLLNKLQKKIQKSFPTYLWTIKMIDKEAYNTLQQLIREEISESFENKMFPVQYDDIMWRRLNR